MGDGGKLSLVVFFVSLILRSKRYGKTSKRESVSIKFTVTVHKFRVSVQLQYSSLQ